MQTRASKRNSLGNQDNIGNSSFDHVVEKHFKVGKPCKASPSPDKKPFKPIKRPTSPKEIVVEKHFKVGKSVKIPAKPKEIVEENYFQVGKP